MIFFLVENNNELEGILVLINSLVERVNGSMQMIGHVNSSTSKFEIDSMQQITIFPRMFVWLEISVEP